MTYPGRKVRTLAMLAELADSRRAVWITFQQRPLPAVVVMNMPTTVVWNAMRGGNIRVAEHKIKLKKATGMEVL